RKPGRPAVARVSRAGQVRDHLVLKAVPWASHFRQSTSVIAPIVRPIERSNGIARYQRSAPARPPGSLTSRSTYALARWSLRPDRLSIATANRPPRDRAGARRSPRPPAPRPPP